MNIHLKRNALIALTSILGFFVCTSTLAIPQQKEVESLNPPKGQVLLLKALGKGVQIYACKSKPNTINQYEWTLIAPDANLLNPNNQERLGKHYAGPTWQANDGSKVVGSVQAKTKAPQPNAVPWLLLKAKSNEGTGIFSKVTYIQRLNTVGGVAPSDGCNSDHADTEARINYTADYYFYGK